MRIIGGTLGGRRFSPPAKNWPTRPTTDYSKEALYNILHFRIPFEGIRMLDLFGGTGNHSFELISRGAQLVDYVDKFGPACAFVKKQAKAWGIEDRLNIHKMDVFQFMRRCDVQFDYIFAGPPYPLPNIPDIPTYVFEHDLLEEAGLFVLEHNAQHNFTDAAYFQEERNYGGTYFSFFAR